MDGQDLYLDPAVSYSVAQAMAGPDRIPISEQTLRLRLNERGLLASVDTARETLKVRRIIEGGSKEVLHLRIGDLLGTRERAA